MGLFFGFSGKAYGAGLISERWENGNDFAWSTNAVSSYAADPTGTGLYSAQWTLGGSTRNAKNWGSGQGAIWRTFSFKFNVGTNWNTEQYFNLSNITDSTGGPKLTTVRVGRHTSGFYFQSFYLSNYYLGTYRSKC